MCFARFRRCSPRSQSSSEVLTVDAPDQVDALRSALSTALDALTSTFKAPDRSVPQIDNVLCDAILTIERSGLAAEAQERPTPEWLAVPRQPHPAHLESMAARYRHDFGLLDSEHRAAICGTMLQLYEEATGQGLYRIQRPSKPGQLTGS